MRKSSSKKDSHVFDAQSPVPVVRLEFHPLDALDVGGAPVAPPQWHWDEDDRTLGQSIEPDQSAPNYCVQEVLSAFEV